MLIDQWTGDPIDDFDTELAAGYIGKYVLVGISITTNEGELLARHEYHGTIASANPSGIDLELHGVNEGKSWRMPPWFLELHPAKPADYRLHSTDETVENPDFVFTMTIRQPPRQ